ncbi:MAG: hypothetical protein QOD51_3017, partial [Candidatus Eremiobacteraeota bacterium]|nr:hypothetical protein [Candidatus Eremiobacteraeota bacterium]
MMRPVLWASTLALIAAVVCHRAEAYASDRSPVAQASFAPLPTTSVSPSPLPSPPILNSPAPAPTGASAQDVDRLLQRLNDYSSHQRYAAALPDAKYAVKLATNDTQLSAKSQEKLLAAAAKVYYRNGLFSEASQATEQVAVLQSPGSTQRAWALSDLSALQRLDGRPQAAAATDRAAKEISGTSPVHPGPKFSVFGS